MIFFPHLIGFNLWDCPRRESGRLRQLLIGRGPKDLTIFLDALYLYNHFPATKPSEPVKLAPKGE